MKVYVVLKIYAGEDAEVEKIYTDKHKAIKYVNIYTKEIKKKKEDSYISYEIEEHEVEK